MNYPIDASRHLFELEEGITYLNCANMSPMLHTVRQAGLQALDTRAAPWKIAGADWFTQAEILRELAATVFQTHGNNIALVPSVSYGLAVAAKNLPMKPGQSIMVLEDQFPSNYYVWEQLARRQQLQLITIPRSQEQNITDSILAAINNQTGLVAIPNCHWMDGAHIDLEAVSGAVRKVGASLVLDLSQSLGALPVDIDRIQPDFAVSVGYKWMLGPYGLGYMYVAPKWQAQGDPLEYSWLTKNGAEDFAGLTNYKDGYRHGARRFDMGEFPQFNLLPMCIAALQQIIHWKPAAIQQQLTTLTGRIVAYKKEKGIGLNKEHFVGHMCSIPLGDRDVTSLKKRLEQNKVIVSFRGSSIRVSPHLYNDVPDLDNLLACLEA
ncbi:aminotransferase class V-fold PLP-dependent enzyme [Paraflavitalea soli]|uniref:Aminotransferase class V-fold PLP-dependent enzyme n=1 Tax=Paraflavitalea soli TaxID=2315862 RepID=A0A3B7MPQ4_9BACT|nr:aminotransferase class V-fold PLP-dependent enzyme [Paraflavitalea soli]AXY75030.1 aminotransferase class V-fold PLP-dependent enzyme [Paraflavitalea soli]